MAIFLAAVWETIGQASNIKGDVGANESRKYDLTRQNIKGLDHLAPCRTKSITDTY